MEGISHEVCSLAGTLRLSRLIALYDDNGISIDGEVRHWFGDDTVRRFEAYGWNVIAGIDGHDVFALGRAIEMAADWARNGRDGRFAPTLIQCKTVIGKGSPNRAGTAKAHGEPLGAEEIASDARGDGARRRRRDRAVADPARGQRRVGCARARRARAGALERHARRLPRRASRARRRVRTPYARRPARRLGRDRRANGRRRDRQAARRSPPARHRRTRSITSDRRCPRCSAAPPTSPAATSPTSPVAARCARRTPACNRGATSTTACASSA